MFLYLWRNRIKTKERAYSIKLWAKRLWTSPELLRLIFRLILLKMRGANLNGLVVCSPLNLRGPANRLTVGDGSILGRVEIHLLSNIEVGCNVVINDGVRLLTGSHDIQDPLYTHHNLPITIKDYAWVATGAIILPGVTIGSGAVIGAGAVVAKSIPDGAVVVGNPAKLVTYRDFKNLRYVPARNGAAVEAWLGKSDEKNTSL